MKRALAILAVCSLFGFAGLAQLSGSWSSEITFNFLKDFDEFFDLSSDFALDYTVGGLTLGLEMEFDGDVGFSGFDFTASGTIGVFTIESTMSFVPNFVTDYTYNFAQTPSITVVTASTGTQTASVPIYKTYTTDPTVTKTFAPKFDEWTVDISLNFGGVDIGAYFYLEGLDDAYSYNDVWYWDGSSAVQTKSTTEGICLTTTGSGWKFSFSGEVNGVTVTSYTYFNLYEYDAYWSTNPRYGLNLGKRGIYKIPSSGCTMGFSEEYLLIEGLSLCCGTTIDTALKVTCSGFSYLRFLVKDIPFACCGISLDLGISYGLTSKSVSFLFDIGDLEDCIGIDLEVVPSNSIVDGIRVKSIDIDCEFAECLSFSATTVLYKDSAGLFSLKTLTSDDEYHFFVPDICGHNASTGEQPVEATTGVGYYTEVDVAKYKWMAWESFTVELCGPACCGGEYEVEITTYFGDKYELKGWGYEYIDCSGDLQKVYWGTVTDADITDPTTKPSMSSKAEYEALTSAALFNWMATEASFSLPILGDTLTLDLGAFVSVRGFESLDVGVSFEF